MKEQIFKTHKDMLKTLANRHTPLVPKTGQYIQTIGHYNAATTEIIRKPATITA